MPKKLNKLVRCLNDLLKAKGNVPVFVGVQLKNNNDAGRRVFFGKLSKGSGDDERFQVLLPSGRKKHFSVKHFSVKHFSVQEAAKVAVLPHTDEYPPETPWNFLWIGGAAETLTDLAEKYRPAEKCIWLDDPDYRLWMLLATALCRCIEYSLKSKWHARPPEAGIVDIGGGKVEARVRYVNGKAREQLGGAGFCWSEQYRPALHVKEYVNVKEATDECQRLGVRVIGDPDRGIDALGLFARGAKEHAKAAGTHDATHDTKPVYISPSDSWPQR